MPEPTIPDDELMRTARAYMARLSSEAPPRNLAEDAVKAAFSRRRRFSLAGVIGASAVIVAGAAAAAVALAFHSPPTGGVPGHTPPPMSSTSSSATPTATPAIVPPATPTPTAAVNVCQVNPAPGTAAQVIISRPAAHAAVTSPLNVNGKINAFEATFQIALKDAAGRNLATKTGHSRQGQTLSSFSEGVPFAVTAPTPACVWIFQLSAKDGSPQAVAQVPITLMPR